MEAAKAPASIHFFSGILGLLNSVNAAKAPLSVAAESGEGSTLASHAEHLRWSLENANRTIRGEAFNGRWKESWKIIAITPPDWDALRNALKSEFRDLIQLLQNTPEITDHEMLLGVMALLPHAAYHLGTIRQMIERAQAVAS